MTESIYDIPLKRLDDAPASLADFKGSVLLIVNVASACGLTPQYQGLELLYERFRDRGLVVLAFPCNDFGGQEPGTAEEIGSFCATNYKVAFPLFAKLNINEGKRHALYEALIRAQPMALTKPGSDFRQRLEGYGFKSRSETDVLWNFEKFLLDRKGNVIGRYAPDLEPDDPILLAAINQSLADQ